MELEFKDTGRRRWRLVVAVGILLAGMTAAVTYYLVTQSQPQAKPGGTAQTVPAVVALRDIPALKQIESSDVTVKQVATDLVTKGTLDTVDKAIGQVAAVSIVANELVTQNLLVAGVQGGGKFSILGPGETIGPSSPPWRAISFTVNDPNATGGLIAANDMVDIIVGLPFDASSGEKLGFVSQATTKVTYQDVQVLERAGTSYIVKVSLGVAEEIAHLQTVAGVTFSLALRPTQDNRIVNISALGATTDRIFERYGFVVPRQVPLASPLPVQPVPQPSPIIQATPAPSAIAP